MVIQQKMGGWQGREHATLMSHTRSIRRHYRFPVSDLPFPNYRFRITVSDLCLLVLYIGGAVVAGLGRDIY